MNAETLVPSLNIFLVEDSTLVRKRLAALLEALGGVKIVGEADEPVSALAGIAAAEDVDIAIVDLQLLEGSSGLTVLKGLASQHPGIVPIVLTNSALPQYRDACFAAGARYFFDKATEIGTLRDVVRRFVEDNDSV
ncbi:response regulator [Paraburkholderia kururiensis]|uniref:response regulator n=1 Tax=Paraburkholderia kururiensis TaxID=984307 RepID=UPI0005A7411C|nr:response regulator transcription factor [Paraburkholderia kururiensis]